MSNILNIKGVIKFDIPLITKKHKLQASWRKVAMVVFNDDMEAYYRWFLKKRFDLNLLPTLRGSHITFIDEKIDDNKFEFIKNKYDKRIVDVQLDVSLIRSNVKHWWIKAHSNDLASIRNEFKLPKKYVGLHMTIGLTKGDELELSEQIINYMKTYNL